MSLFLGVFAVWDLASTSVVSSDHGDPLANNEVIHATSGAVRSISLADDRQYVDVVQGPALFLRRDMQTGGELLAEELSTESLLRVQFIGDARGWIAINSHSEVELIRGGALIWRGRMPEQYEDEILIDCALSGVSRQLVVVSKQGSIWQFDVDDTGINPISHCSVGVPIADMKASPTGDQILLVAANRDVVIWDLHQEEVIRRIAASDQDVRFARWSPDGKRFVTFGLGGMLKVWNASTGALVSQLTIDSQMIISAELSFDGTKLAAGDGHLIRVWDLSDHDHKSTLVGHLSMVCSLAFANEEDALFSGDLRGGLRRWSLADNQQVWASP